MAEEFLESLPPDSDYLLDEPWDREHRDAFNELEALEIQHTWYPKLQEYHCDRDEIFTKIKYFEQKQREQYE